MFYSDETIRQLKEYADISIVIERFVPLKRASGGKFLGVCPFHDDKRPSMNVNPNMGIYKCFACGAGGDVFRFVMEHEKMDFRSAIQFVAGVVGFNLPSLAEEQDENYEEKDLVRKLNELAQNFFKQELEKSDFAKKYLDERGMNSKTRDLFGFGYAPATATFLEHAVKNKFPPNDIVKAGLASEKNGKAIDKFHDRLMLPICSLSGAVVGFGGRDLSGNSPAKYMNSPETALYNKSEILFGLDKSRRAIQKENSVILVEGYFDLISLFQSGIENAVAISGIALSEIQCRQLARYTKNAYISLDGDVAGQRATARCIEVLLRESFAVNIVNLMNENGEKTDPDSLVKNEGAEAFRNLLAKSADWLEYLQLQSKPSSAEDKANFASKVKNLIASMNNAELRNQYLNLLQERFGVSRNLPINKPAAASQRFNSSVLPSTNSSALKDEAQSIPFSSIPGNEVRLVNLIFKNPQIQNFALTHCDPSLLSSAYLGELLDYGYALLEETGKIDLKNLYDKLPPLHRELLWKLPDEKWTEESASREFCSGVLDILISNVKKELRNSRDNFDLYKELQSKISIYKQLKNRSENGENILGEMP